MWLVARGCSTEQLRKARYAQLKSAAISAGNRSSMWSLRTQAFVDRRVPGAAGTFSESCEGGFDGPSKSASRPMQKNSLIALGDLQQFTHLPYIESLDVS